MDDVAAAQASASAPSPSESPSAASISPDPHANAGGGGDDAAATFASFLPLAPPIDSCPTTGLSCRPSPSTSPCRGESGGVASGPARGCWPLRSTEKSVAAAVVGASASGMTLLFTAPAFRRLSCEPAAAHDCIKGMCAAPCLRRFSTWFLLPWPKLAKRGPICWRYQGACRDTGCAQYMIPALVQFNLLHNMSQASFCLSLSRDA